MKTTKKVMTEVLESEKDIIERLTNEIDSLKEQLAEAPNYKLLYQELVIKYNTLEEQNKELLLKVELLDNKLEKYERNEKRAGIIDFKNSDEYKIMNEKIITLEETNESLLRKTKKNDINNNKFDNSLLDSKINEALDIQRINLENNFNSYKKEQEDKYNSLYNSFTDLKNQRAKHSIPTPSTSTDNNKNEKTNIHTNCIMPLSENLFEIVHYRRSTLDKFKPSYVVNNKKCYLKCCNQDYNEKEISNTSSITCFKCYKTYNLSKEKDKFSNLHEIFYTILPEHIIKNEEELYKKIKCNECNCTSKKEIDLCHKCKKEKLNKIFINSYKVFSMPNEKEIGYNSKILAASETFIKLDYLYKLYDTAETDGIDTTNLKELIDYIKSNKLLEDKQYNMIKFKIQRAASIIKLYNNEKYIPIFDYIKRINFKVNDIARLIPDQWNNFRVFIENDLDKQLEKIKNKDNLYIYKCSLCKNEYKSELEHIIVNICNICEDNCNKNKHEFSDSYDSDNEYNHFDKINFNKN